jgi:hypothetical protein
MLKSIDRRMRALRRTALSPVRYNIINLRSGAGTWLGVTTPPEEDLSDIDFKNGVEVFE